MMQSKPVPKPVFWWPYKCKLWKREDGSIFELERLIKISRTCNIGLQWAPDERINLALAFEPEILGLHHNIFHDQEDDESIHQYLINWYFRCKHVKDLIGDQRCEIFLEYELIPEAKEKPEVIYALNAAYDICKYVFNCPVHYYNWGSANAPISQMVQSDTACVTCHWQQGSLRNYNAMKNVTRPSQTKPVRVTLSPDSCYKELPWEGRNGRNNYVTEPNQLGQVWSAGKSLARDPAVQSLMVWPTPTMSEHLMHLFMGMNGETP